MSNTFQIRRIMKRAEDAMAKGAWGDASDLLRAAEEESYDIRTGSNWRRTIDRMRQELSVRAAHQACT